MRVLQTSKAYAPLVGGIETTITNLSEGLARMKGMTVEALVCNHVRSSEVQREAINGVTVTRAPSWGFVASLPLSPSYYRLLSAAHGDILHIHEPFPLASLSYLASENIARNFSRVVVSWHSDIVRQRWMLAPYRPLIHRFLSRVDRILVSTQNLLEASEFLPAYRERCEVIPLGVKLGWVKRAGARRARVSKLRQTHGGPLLLFVGRLVYYKGLQTLIDSLALLLDAQLVIIGSGPLREQLRQQAEQLGIAGRVAFLSPLTEEDLHAYYEACDIFILPSTEKSETYGLVQIEAMASGKPVISTNIGTGVTFLNIDGVTGLTVPPRDPRALASAVRKLIDDKGLRLSLGQKARKRALAEFSDETMVKKTFAVYERLLGIGR